MNPVRQSDDDGSSSFAHSSVQPDVDLDASSPLVVGNKLAVGLRLDEYEISGVLGEGGFGIVYLAWDHSLQRRLAIKEYFPASLAWRARGVQVQVKDQRYVESFDAGLRSFINEAKLLASFDHPSLVKVHRFWQANGTAYMVMPFYEGVTLKHALTSSDRAPDERWLRELLQPLLAALEYMHNASCYHRDIAPDNVLLVDEGRPLLLDFGAARRVIGDMTKAVTVILKPGYAPIEQYGDMPGIGQGPWTDIYALGAVLHFAITGTVPRASVTRLVADDYVPLAQREAGRYSDKLLRTIDRMLVVRPEGRPQTVGVVRALMDIELSQESGRIVLPPRVAPDAEPWARPPTLSQPGPLVPKPAAKLPMPEVPPQRAESGHQDKLSPARRPVRPTWGLLAGAALALLLLLFGLWRYTASMHGDPGVVDSPTSEPLPVPEAASAPSGSPASRPEALPPPGSAEPAASAPVLPGPAASSVDVPLPSPPASAVVAPTNPPISRPESPPLAPVPAPSAIQPPLQGPAASSTSPAGAASKPVPAAEAPSKPVRLPAAAPSKPVAAPVAAPSKPAQQPAAAPSKPAARPPAAAPSHPPKRVEAAAPPPAAQPEASPRIPSSARCADIIQRVSIGEALTAADRRILKEECGK